MHKLDANLAVWEKRYGKFDESQATTGKSYDHNPMVDLGSYDHKIIKSYNHSFFVDEKALFVKYGDILGIVTRHPTFKRVHGAGNGQGWGTWPQALTNYCKKKGVGVVLSTILEIEADPWVRYRGAELSKRLKKKPDVSG